MGKKKNNEEKLIKEKENKLSNKYNIDNILDFSKIDDIQKDKIKEKSAKKRKTKRKKETEDSLEYKLQYIGLELDDLDNLNKQECINSPKLNFAPNSLALDKDKKIYKYVNIKDILIYITPCSRDEDIKVKISEAKPISEYLKSSSQVEEDRLRYLTFLNMLNNSSVKGIEKVEKLQEKIKEKEPFFVTYPESNLWNIYYSDKMKKYFMLFCSDEINSNNFFYLLKKHLEILKTNEDEYIFAPINMTTYSEIFFDFTETNEIENILWYFTRNWPITYEIFHKDGTYTYMVIGKIKIYDRIKSKYRIEIKTKEEALNIYNLLKLMYVIQKETNRNILFSTYTNDSMEIQFFLEDEEVKQENIEEILEKIYQKLWKEYRLLKTQLIVKDEEKEKEINLKERNNKIYFAMQRKITEYLDSRKSFFGKCKYYITKKINIIRDDIEEDLNINGKHVKEVLEERKKEKEENILLKYFSQKEILDEKNLKEEQYITAEDIKKIYNIKEVYAKILRDITSDIIASKKYNENMKKRISSGKKYLQEIDVNKRNIFEFFRFVREDGIKQIEENTGSLKEFESEFLKNKKEKEEELSEKMQKTFDFETEYYVFGENIDKLQRKELSKEELSAIHTFTKIELFKVYNMIKTGMLDSFSLEEVMSKLKIEFNKAKKTEKDNFLLLGNAGGTEKVRYLKDKSFREVDRNYFANIKYRPDMEKLEFLNKCKKTKEIVDRALTKININENISIYKAGIEELQLKDGKYEICNLDVVDELKHIETDNDEIFLNIFKINGDFKALFFTNSIFYRNDNKTLPYGMNESTQCLIDVSLYDFYKEKEKDLIISGYFNKEDDICLQKKKVKVIEYVLKLKEK